MPDKHDFFSIVDRKSDMIAAGGFNIYWREARKVLFEHPHIREALTVDDPRHRS